MNRITPEQVKAAYECRNLKPAPYQTNPTYGECCALGAMVQAKKPGARINYTYEAARILEITDSYAQNFMTGFDGGMVRPQDVPELGRYSQGHVDGYNAAQAVR